MDKLRWGILSTATIAREKVIPAINASQFGEVKAIASRDLSRARRVAGELGVPKSYGAYKDLLSDRDIDAVYIPLPNHLHVPWAVRALQAGKHVLCEKPIALDTAECEKLIEAAARHPKQKIMEAFMYRFHPQWIRARELVHEGRIGQLRTIHTFFSFFDDDPKSIVNQRDSGGGALMDIGCYGISLARFIYDAEPQRVLGCMEYDPATRVDRLTSAVMEFFQGTATFTCAIQLADHQRVNIFGTNGRIEIEIPFNAPSDRPCRIWLETMLESGDMQLEEIQFDVCDQYTLQADAFAWSIFDDQTVPTPLSDAVANMRVIERVVSSAAKNAWT